MHMTLPENSFQIWYTKENCEVVFLMKKRQIETEINEIKMDYINLQGDIEKLESTGNDSYVQKAEVRLASLEERLAELNKQLDAFES